MADKKISALMAASLPLVGTEVLPLVQSGATVKVANNDLRPKQIQSNTTSGVLQVAGPAAASTRVMTTPDANFTVARTDAAQSFTGNQTLADGNLIIGTAGKGIDFSADPSAAGMTSELLDDYEEGTWTPTDASGAGLTLVTATGFYTKVGRVVHWQANIDYPVTADGSNSLIGGLPFTITEGSSPGRAGSFITATTVTSLVQTLQITPTNVRLYKAGFVRATNAELSGGTIYMAGFYIV